jgi:hypothetical protein
MVNQTISEFIATNVEMVILGGLLGLVIAGIRIGLSE